jgi:HTH-type transcriptional regulator / antitoxin HigA
MSFDPDKYRALLAATLPAVIETNAEHDRLIKAVEDLMHRGEENLSPEEGKLLDLLANLIEDYERKIYPPAELAPHELLQFLIQEHRLKQKDLVDVFGAESRVSDAVKAKRAISKAQAKKLSERFKVPAELFI